MAAQMLRQFHVPLAEGFELRIFRLLGLAPIMSVVVVMGCQSEPSLTVPQTYPVKGRVILSNGEPLNSGRIAFIPTDVFKPPASAPIGPDGTFTLTTKAEGDGAAAGDYKVRIEPAPAAADEKRRVKKPKFPVKYVDEDSSGLLVRIAAEPNELKPFKLK